MRDGEVLTMDEDATVAEAQRVSETAWARLFAQRPDLEADRRLAADAAAAVG